MGDFIKWLTGLFGSTTTPPPDPNDPCNAAACVDAKQRLANARSKFNSICTVLSILNSILKALQQVVAPPLWILVLVFLVLSLIGLLIGGVVGAGIVGAIATAVLAVWFLSWLLIPVVNPPTTFRIVCYRNLNAQLRRL